MNFDSVDECLPEGRGAASPAPVAESQFVELVAVPTAVRKHAARPVRLGTTATIDPRWVLASAALAAGLLEATFYVAAGFAAAREWFRGIPRRPLWLAGSTLPPKRLRQ